MSENRQETVAQEAEFNWDSLGKKQQFYSKEERSRLEEMYDTTLKQITEHDVIDGIVVGMTSKDVLVNIGYKSDGVVPLNEMRYNPELKIGDKIEVYVESQEDKSGQLLLSHKKARALRSWDRINEALENDEVIKGFVKCRTKGGLIADVFGIEAFLPGSQIDVKPIRDYDVYVGKIMEFKVVKINKEFRNVVVSHKALIEEELEQQKKDIISKLEKGQILEGIVKNITSYGVFIDLGGVDGLIHITDLSWGRINHPEEIVKLDEKINVVILDFDDSKKRIALGLKQLSAHPWDALDQNIKVGDKVTGKVVVIADYGAFIEVRQSSSLSTEKSAKCHSALSNSSLIHGAMYLQNIRLTAATPQQFATSPTSVFSLNSKKVLTDSSIFPTSAGARKSSILQSSAKWAIKSKLLFLKQTKKTVASASATNNSKKTHGMFSKLYLPKTAFTAEQFSARTTKVLSLPCHMVLKDLLLPATSPKPTAPC
jgi:predicted RNA-binding protein with RPS1 domain